MCHCRLFEHRPVVLSFFCSADASRQRPRARATRCHRPIATSTGSANAASSTTIAKATTRLSDQWPRKARPAERDRESQVRAWALNTKSQRRPGWGSIRAAAWTPFQQHRAISALGARRCQASRTGRARAQSRADRRPREVSAPGGDRENRSSSQRASVSAATRAGSSPFGLRFERPLRVLRVLRVHREAYPPKRGGGWIAQSLGPPAVASPSARGT